MESDEYEGSNDDLESPTLLITDRFDYIGNRRVQQINQRSFVEWYAREALETIEILINAISDDT